LLVGGIEKVFEIGRVYRNEGISTKHNPEFTLLELYQSYGDYNTMMDLTEDLIVTCVKSLGDNMKLTYGQNIIDFTQPFQRTTYADLFEEHVGISIDDIDACSHLADQIGFSSEGKHPDVIRNFYLKRRWKMLLLDLYLFTIIQLHFVLLPRENNQIQILQKGLNFISLEWNWQMLTQN
jgi:lysyl-tRNA synthetase class II